MNPITSSRRTYVEDWVPYTFSDTTLDFIMINQTDTHCVNKRVTVIAIIEHDFAAHGWNPDTVTITSNTRHHMLEQIFHAIAFQLAETQGIQQCDRS
ncbi:hypothetical protein D3C71_1211180 [compost metagenome]